MKATIHKNMIISKRLEHVLTQLEHVTIFDKEHKITPAQGGGDGRDAKDFPRA